MARFGIRHLFFIFILAIPGSAVSFAQPDPVPELSTKRLLNGLQVIVAPTPGPDDSMAIGLTVRYGSAFDGARKGGLANLLSRMFMKATIDKTGGEIQDELSYLGASLEVQCNWDGFRFLMKGKGATFERSLLLLYQVVCEAQFTGEDLSVEKQELIRELQQSSDPRRRIREQFERVLFRGTTYGRSPKGIPEIIKGMTPGDLRYFHRRHFSPGDASLLVVGNVPPEQVLQKASRIWGLWVRKDRIPFTFTPSREPVEDIHLIEDDPGSPAVQFILGNIALERQNPLFGDALLATRILQERLKELLPTSLLTVGLEGRRMPGYFFIQGQAAAEEAVEQILNIQKAVEEMKRVPVSAEELARAQNRIIEEFNEKLKTAEGLCRIMMESELYFLGGNYASTYPDRIRNCDANSVRQAARDRFLPGKKVMILRGPVNELVPALERIGEFKRLLP